MNLKTQQACRHLKAGKLLVYPTESVFGIGCLALNQQALKHLRGVKRRESQKGFIVLCASLEQMLSSFPDIHITTEQRARLLTRQAHPTTWLIPYPQKKSPLLLGRNHKIAVRITEHPVARALCEACGPIVSSSANPAGIRTPSNMLRVRHLFRSQVGYYLNEKLGGVRKTSQIIDLVNGEVIRGA